MATKAPVIVRAKDGRLGTIVDRGVDEAGRLGSTVDVLLEDGERLAVSSRLLAPQADGSYELDLSGGAVEEDSTVVVPVVAESVEVGKRRVETGRVRVRKTVRTTEKVVDEPLIVEEVEVERVPINRVIAEAVGPRQEGDTLIVPLLEEVLVVEKRLMLREEIRITRRKAERRSPETVTLRSEEATVERVEGSRPVDEAGV